MHKVLLLMAAAALGCGEEEDAAPLVPCDGTFSGSWVVDIIPSIPGCPLLEPGDTFLVGLYPLGEPARASIGWAPRGRTVVVETVDVGVAGFDSPECAIEITAHAWTEGPDFEFALYFIVRGEVPRGEFEFSSTPRGSWDDPPCQTTGLLSPRL